MTLRELKYRLANLPDSALDAEAVFAESDDDGVCHYLELVKTVDRDIMEGWGDYADDAVEVAVPKGGYYFASGC